MKKTTLLLIIAAIITILTGCGDFTSGDRFTDDTYYIVNGKLVVGSPIDIDNSIFVGRAISTNGGNMNDLFVMDADVRITDIASGEVWPLSFSFEIIDTSHMKVGYIDPTQTLIPLAEREYKLEVAVINDSTGIIDSIWAYTTTPKQTDVVVYDDIFTIDENAAEYPVFDYQTDEATHPIKIIAEDDSPHNILFEFYCLEDFPNVWYVKELFGETKPDEEDEYEDPNNGEPRKIEYFYSYKPSLDDEIGEYTISNPGYKYCFVFKGDYRLTIYNLDDNYYKYLYKLDGYRFGGISSPNGKSYGYFGSVSGSEMYTHIVNDE